MRPSFRPTSAFTMPQWSRISALVITVSTAPRCVRRLALAHAVADDLAAAELHLLAVGGEVALDLDHEVGIGEPHRVAGRRPEHARIGRARIGEGHGGGFLSEFGVSPLPACGERAAEGSKPAQQARVRGRLRKRRSGAARRLFLHRPLTRASLRSACSAEGRTLSPQAGRGESAPFHAHAHSPPITAPRKP